MNEFQSKPPGQQPPRNQDGFRGRKPLAPKIDERTSIRNSLTERGGSKPVAERMKTSPEAVSHVASLLKDENDTVRHEAAGALALAAEMKVNISAAVEALKETLKAEQFLYDKPLRAATLGIINNGFGTSAGFSLGFDILACGFGEFSTNETIKSLILIAKKQISIPSYVLAMAKDTSSGRKFMDSNVEKLLIECAKNEVRPFLSTKPLNGEKLHALLTQANEEGTLPIYNQALNSMTHHGESGIVKENARFALDAIRPAKS